MDPCEILGIRPNAGRDEIEPAYKGRRSQYHPDRYAQSDAEAWATGKLQAFNQAYAVLSDPEERARFDQGHMHRPPWSEAPQAPPCACSARLGTLRRASAEGCVFHRRSSPARWTATTRIFDRKTSSCGSSACSSMDPAKGF
ncbi:TPA: DnaJ domain-containing protein [Stenotrophomonas maltophilia]